MKRSRRWKDGAGGMGCGCGGRGSSRGKTGLRGMTVGEDTGATMVVAVKGGAREVRRVMCLRTKTRLWLERPTKPLLVLNYVVKGLSFITIASPRKDDRR